MARDMKSNRKTELLWKEYFKEPSLWYHKQNSSILPHFSHRTTFQSLSIDACHNPSWIFEELKRRSMIVSFLLQEESKDKFKNRNKKNHEEELKLLSLLKSCAKKKDLCEGIRLHSDLQERGLLETNLYLASTLIHMYVRCGVLSEAKKLLENLPIRDVVTWSTLMTGYVRLGYPQEALFCFEKMQSEGITPNPITFTCILKACGSIRDIDKGKEIHADIVDMGLLNKDAILGTVLVDMYAKCGMLCKARQVLEELPARDIWAWSALITGYVDHGLGHEALQCVEQMENEGISPDSFTLVSLLKACGSIGAIDKGKQIHDEIVSKGMLEKEVMIGNALVDMYAKCGMLVKARQVLEELLVRDVISWNALIAGYVQQGQGHDALDCFQSMKTEGFAPDVITYSCVLKACGNVQDIERGKKTHDEIVSKGLLEKEILIGNALVDMYVKFGHLAKAQQVLKELPYRDIVSWSTLIAGYAQHERSYEALNCFEVMKRDGISPNSITFISVIKACGNIRAIEEGKKIHDEIIGKGLFLKDVVLGTVLVDMYAKCGMLSKAQEVLEEMSITNVVSWSTLIAGYVEQEQGHEALNCFKRMQSMSFLILDVVTFTYALKACGLAGAIDKGIQIHNEIVTNGLLEKDIILGNALIDMYVKCGDLAKAKKALEELPLQDIISWNSLITGYALRGQSQESLECLAWMQSEGVSPDEVTFLCILNAFSHSGLLDEARMFYGNMSRNHGIAPTLEHHTSMVVMLGCAGRFDEAISVIKVMPSCDHVEVWLSLLGACKKWGNVTLGRLVFDQIVQLNDGCAACYILMANIFANAGMQEDKENVEAMGLKYGSIGN